jgi:RHS repeat-associated protein
MAGAQAIAQYERRSDGTNEVVYLHRDHQGSVVATTSSGGVLKQRFEYEPFGARWRTVGSAPDDTERGFTDHEHLDAVDLVHMNGRVLDPMLGRFISADPFVQAPFNSQSLNRYSYVLNNPTSLVDPSGFQASCPDCGPGDSVPAPFPPDFFDRQILPGQTPIPNYPPDGVPVDFHAATLPGFNPYPRSSVTAPAPHNSNGVATAQQTTGGWAFHSYMSDMESIDAAEGEARWSRTLQAASALQIDISNVHWDNRYAMSKVLGIGASRYTDIQYADNRDIASSYLREGYTFLGGYAELGGKNITIFRSAVAGRIVGIEIGLRGTPQPVDYRGHIAGLFVLGHELQHTRQRRGQRVDLEWDANEWAYDLVRRCQATIPICQ